MSEITPEAPVEGYTSLRELFFEMAKVFFLALVIIIPIRIFLFQPFFVQGSSMEPNFKDGEYLVISEFGYKETKLLAGLRFGGFRELHRQDTFVFRYPGNESQFFIKRLIAFPGESVAIKNNRVFLYNAEYPNGFVLDESAYLPSTVSMPDMER
ncbi:MAG: signal peptidase I [Candidatus Moraniibacteriota bacterium]